MVLGGGVVLLHEEPLCPYMYRGTSPIRKHPPSLQGGPKEPSKTLGIGLQQSHREVRFLIREALLWDPRTVSVLDFEKLL